VLYELLRRQFRVLPMSFVHSSVSKRMPQKLVDIFNCSGAMCLDRGSYQLGFTVVWKSDKQCPSLTVNTSQSAPICGEGNMARFLARLIGFYDNNDNIVLTTRIDDVIDMCVQLVSGDASKRAAILKSFGGLLDRKQWILGTSAITLADMVAWSAVLQATSGTQQRTGGLVPDSAVRQWLAGCSKLQEFVMAISLRDQLPVR